MGEMPFLVTVSKRLGTTVIEDIAIEDITRWRGEYMDFIFE